ncbi:MAG TPA: hypothetical protein VJV78_07730 [Polyangiales bacterium]|nr:hypothetical protein [Polyangiales bacterium]
MRRLRALGACLILLGLSACDPSLDTSLEHKECDEQGQCLPGYACSEDGICEALDAGTRGDPSRTQPDASERDAQPPAGCGTGSMCDGTCVDTSSDVAHCGGCGRQCTDSEHGSAACDGGVCSLTCSEGYAPCGDGCYLLESDPLHCGACTVSCGDPEGGLGVCESGTCGMRCLAGFILCNGKCVRADEPAHCGKCTTACQADQSCAGGTCVRACPAGTVDCGRSCVDLKSEPKHCGSCDKACGAPAGALASCQAGSCAWQCEGALSKCGEACLDLQSDLANCGECGKRCAAPPENGSRACMRGACVLTCAAGYTDCAGACVNGSVVEQARAANLGMLGVCDAALALQNQAKCAGMGQTTTYCDGACVNLNANASHCGSCGHACARQFCYRATCL